MGQYILGFFNLKKIRYRPPVIFKDKTRKITDCISIGVSQFLQLFFRRDAFESDTIAHSIVVINYPTLSFNQKILLRIDKFSSWAVKFFILNAVCPFNYVLFPLGSASIIDKCIILFKMLVPQACFSFRCAANSDPPSNCTLILVCT